jgi:hypothetical protein
VPSPWPFAFGNDTHIQRGIGAWVLSRQRLCSGAIDGPEHFLSTLASSEPYGEALGTVHLRDVGLGGGEVCRLRAMPRSITAKCVDWLRHRDS